LAAEGDGRGGVNWETVTALVDATADARAVLAELHGAVKDARGVIADARQVIARDVRAEITDTVKTELGKLGDETELAMGLAVEKVIAQFDEMAKLLTGGDKANRRAGKPPLTDLVRQIAERRGDLPPDSPQPWRPARPPQETGRIRP
jgi:hypothetical protein